MSVGPDFDPLAPESFESFHREFTGLRSECPVAHSDAWNGFWALTRYDDVLAAAGDPELFTTTVQNVVPKLAFTGRRPPLHFDPPEHTPYRRALNPYFTPAKMEAIEPAVRSVVGELLDPLVAAGGGDVCAEFTHRLPGYVLAEFFNLTPELGMAIREATREFVDAVQRFRADDVKRTSLALYDIARTLIEMRRAEPLDPADDPSPGCSRREWTASRSRTTCCWGRSGSSSSSGWSRLASSSAAWSSISPSIPGCRTSFGRIRV